MTHDYPDIKTQYERLRHENFMLKHENRLLKDQVKDLEKHRPYHVTLRVDDDWDDVQPVA